MALFGICIINDYVLVKFNLPFLFAPRLISGSSAPDGGCCVGDEAKGGEPQ